MADLEFVFFDVLKRYSHGVPNLERRIAEDPSYFVWLVGLVYKRKDGREDPEGWPVSGPNRKAELSRLAYSVLLEVARIPGSKTGQGEINVEGLQAWVSEVRRQSKECGRVEAGTRRRNWGSGWRIELLSYATTGLASCRCYCKGSLTSSSEAVEAWAA